MTNKSKSQTTSMPDSQTTRTFITAYGPKRKVTVDFPDTGRTKQQFKDECDINKIMDRFKVTNTVDWVNRYMPQYLDCTGYDYQQAMQIVSGAKSMFNAMPAYLRTQFDNDPQKFLEFCENPANLPRLREMGLAAPEAVSGPSPTQAAPAMQPAPVPVAPSTIQDAPGT